MLLGSGNVLCVLWGWVKDDNLFNFSGVRYLDSTSLNKTEILTDLNFHFRGEGIHHKLTHNHHVHYHCDHQVTQAEYMDKSLFFFVINRSHHLLKCQVCAVGCDDNCSFPHDPWYSSFSLKKYPCAVFAVRLCLVFDKLYFVICILFQFQSSQTSG